MTHCANSVTSMVVIIIIITNELIYAITVVDCYTGTKQTRYRPSLVRK